MTARGSSRSLVDDADALYDRREAELGEEIMRALERYLLLNIIDQRWREHLYDMDYLREGIHLRGFAQIDPLVAYKNEAFELFSDLMATIWSDFARMVFNVPVEIEEAGDGAGERRPRAAAQRARRRRRRPAASRTPAGATRSPRRSTAAAAASGGQGDVHRGGGAAGRAGGAAAARSGQQIGRNDPCWCGSGKKYKKCHGR